MTAAPHARPRAVLLDRFGRTATDLRISLTDRCSLRCTYCMPAEGLDWLSRSDRLSDDEIVRLANVFVALGVDSIRLTGGEPLVHRTVVDVVARLAALEPRPELSLTTNGISLDKSALDLVRAGLDRVNVSIDTLDRERFRALTRRDRLPDVLRGVAAAADAGLAPVKINSVLMRDSNLAEAPELLGWALRHGYQLRFIEHMPLDADHTWTRARMVTAAEVLDLLQRDFVLAPRGHVGNAPAEEFDVLDGPDRASWATQPGRVGVIASVTRPFCRDCDRLRLTADGQLRTCLFAQHETDLRGPLRAGATTDELAEIIQTAVAGKQAGHGIDAPDFVQPLRTMSAIGG
jgi:cyclic pyranopterin phosphate synthase